MFFSSKNHLLWFIGSSLYIVQEIMRKYSIDIVYFCCRSPRGSVDWNHWYNVKQLTKCFVAPLVGAWIEIWLIIFKSSGLSGRSPRGSVDWNLTSRYQLSEVQVAPLVGAWIEISYLICIILNLSVAPLVGAWIEIKTQRHSLQSCKSRSPRGSVDWNLYI